jgi:hypothetical protein
VSGDISPSGGSWLDAPARPDGEHGQGAAGRRPQGDEPSLARVAGTTLRLWWRRRVLRLPDGARVGTLRWSVLAAVVVVLAGGGAAIAVSGGRPGPKPPKPPAPQHPSAAQLLTASNERAASSWVQAQVDSGAQLGCDPAMCGYLLQAGRPAANFVVFSQGTSVPGSATFVLSTPLLRTRSATKLAAGAPEVVARFGAGQQRVDVLLATSTPAAAFLQAAQHSQHVSARMGKSLARNHRLHAGPVTRRELTSGMVDRRLLVVLKRMLAAHPVSVARFGDADPGASFPVQLRSMTVDGLVHHVGKRKVSYLHADLSLVRGLKPPYTASVQQITRANGGAALLIQVPVTSPAGTG